MNSINITRLKNPNAATQRKITKNKINLIDVI